MDQVPQPFQPRGKSEELATLERIPLAHRRDVVRDVRQRALQNGGISRLCKAAETSPRELVRHEDPEQPGTSFTTPELKRRNGISAGKKTFIKAQIFILE